MRHPRLGLLAALAAVSIAACDSSDSSDESDESWAPGDVFISVQVAASDDVSAKVFVTFSVSHAGVTGPTYHLLNRGDALTACVGAVCKPMTRDDEALRSASFVITGKTYFAELPFIAETPYTISLSRDGNVIAPNSVIALPVPFAILAPPSGLPVTDGQYVNVQWSPPNTPTNNAHASVDSSARCAHQGGAQSERRNSVGFQRPDTGTATVGVDEVFEGYVVRPPLPQAPVLRCDVVLEVEQGRNGTIDSAYKHGAIFARITRSVTIEYTPSQR